MSDLLSVCIEQLGPQWVDFHVIRYLSIFLKYFEKIQVLLKSDSNNRYFTWSSMYIYDNISISSTYNLLQSALQPLWVLACSTIVEYSQQESFYRVPLPAARQTPQPGGPVIRTFPSSGRWNYGREIAENFAESGDFHITFGFFYMP